MGELFCDTGKVVFDAPKDANGHIKGLARRSNNRHKYSVYKCTTCGHYHITTATKKRRTPRKLDKYPAKYEWNQDELDKHLGVKKNKAKR